MALRLVFVRHGLSSFNKKGIVQGRTDDSYLTEEGYSQAKLTGKVLDDINFDAIYSSPLTRASETAKTIEKSLNKNYDINFDENLLEVNLEKWSGLTIEEIKNRYPDDYLNWKNDPEDLCLLNKDKVHIVIYIDGCIPNAYHHETMSLSCSKYHQIIKK